MRLWMLGVGLFLALASLNSCRKDPPPQIPIGIGDGIGGADFDIPPGQDPNNPSGGKEYWKPSQLKNAWITTQDGMVLFSAWCYQTDVETAKAMLKARGFQITEPAK